MTVHRNAIHIRPLQLQDAGRLLEMRLANRDFLQPYEPIRPASHLTLEGQHELLAQAERDFAAGTGYSFGIFLRVTDQLIGRVSLSNVARGAWQNATIGYFLDKAFNGRGYMTDAVRLALRFAFSEAGLHRVQAAIMPRNHASIRVVEKNGFRKEGLSLRYLQINGVWEDHLIYAITAEEFPHYESALAY